MLTAAPFAPYLGATTAVSVSGTTANGALNLPGLQPLMPGALTVRLYNATSVRVYVKFGDSTITATTGDMPIPPGGVEVFSCGGTSYVAGITDGGTGTLYATPGMGA